MAIASAAPIFFSACISGTLLIVYIRGLHLSRRLKSFSIKSRWNARRFKWISEAISEGICIYDPVAGTISDYNSLFANWFIRRATDSADGLTLDDCFGTTETDENQCFRKSIQKAKEGEPQSFDWKTKTAEGQERWLHVSIRRADADKDGIFLIIRISDVTEQRKVAEERARLSDILESIGEGVATADLAGIVTYVNKAWADMHGFSQQDLIGRNLNIFHSEEQLKREVNPFNDIVMRKGWHSGEVGHKHADGTLFFTQMTSTLLKDKDGRPAGYIGVAADLSEKKKVEDALRTSEIKFRHLFNLSPEPITVSDLTGRILDVNEKFCNMSQYARHEIIGKTTLDLGFPPDDRQHFINELTRKGEVTAFEVTLKSKDQNSYQVLLFAKMIEIKNEFYTLTVMHDITDRRRLENRLREAQKMEAIGTLAGGIAHDFNNILSAILGYVELSMLKIDRENRVYNYLNQTLNATNRAKDLVRQILSVSRQTEQKKKPIQVRPIVADVLKLMRASLPSNIEIREKFLSDTGSIMADPGQIHQVLMNLCTNAGQSMHEKGGVLSVELETIRIYANGYEAVPDLSSGSYLRISISDTGHGMSAEVQKRIFDPYFTTKVKGMGTGLGLAVVHGIVKKHGGTVNFYSVPEHGTQFHVYLPIIHTLQSSPEDLLAQTEGEIPGGDERILLVDDEEAIVETGCQMLRHLGYDVVSTMSSREALTIFENAPGRFDLMISDMTMPDMTGDELAEHIMKIRPDMPIILCTGYNARIDEQRALEIGIRAFVFKPVALKKLATTIRQIFDSAAVHTETAPQ